MGVMRRISMGQSGPDMHSLASSFQSSGFLLFALSVFEWLLVCFVVGSISYSLCFVSIYIWLDCTLFYTFVCYFALYMYMYVCIDCLLFY